MMPLFPRDLGVRPPYVQGFKGTAIRSLGQLRNCPCQVQPHFMQYPPRPVQKRAMPFHGVTAEMDNAVRTPGE